MRTRVLGRSGIVVSELCLGAMVFGPHDNNDPDDCVKIIHRALDAGINFIDTADVYNRGESEQIVGRALKGRRDDVVLATKFHQRMGKNPNQWGNSRRWIVKACEDSLRRLDTDYIDIYQAHRPDHRTDNDETLSALSDLVHQGKVRLLGTSTFPAEMIVEMQWAAEKHHFVPIRCEQPPYSLFVRGIERDVLPTCQRYGMGVIPWSPLNGGWLTGKYRHGRDAPEGSRFARWRNTPTWSLESPQAPRKLDLVEDLITLAEDIGTGLIPLALAFTLAHPAVSATIIGPRTVEQLESQLPAAELDLSDEVLDRIDALIPPGTNIDPDDTYYVSPAIAQPAGRRLSGAPPRDGGDGKVRGR